MNEDLAMMAIILTEAKGKDPKKFHKGKPLWHCNIELAEKILKACPNIFKIKNIAIDIDLPRQYTDDDWNDVLEEYVALFNEGFHLHDRLVPVDKMPAYAKKVYLTALKGAFEVLNEE